MRQTSAPPEATSPAAGAATAPWPDWRWWSQPNPDSAVTTISNLAMAQLRRLPPGTLPPVVLKFDASSLPVCLVTFKGEGLNETALRDLAQFQVRNQLASVPGASVPQPFGGRYRQIMVYADPY